MTVKAAALGFIICIKNSFFIQISLTFTTKCCRISFGNMTELILCHTDKIKFLNWRNTYES